MFSRRQFLRTSLKTSTLVALAPTVPGFLAHTARAAAPALTWKRSQEALTPRYAASGTTRLRPSHLAR